MRAVARRAGVSSAAPYRHFADRDALDTAVAIEGFDGLRRTLARALEASTAEPTDPTSALADLGVAYVGFALQRPAVFRLMFGNECDDADSDRVRASQALHALVNDTLADLFPGRASPELATALWGLAHGLAFLHLDGKYRPEPAEEVAERVRASVTAVLTAGRA